MVLIEAVLPYLQHQLSDCETGYVCLRVRPIEDWETLRE